MSYIARSNATRVAAGATVGARTNLAGEIVSTPWETQMMLEGRVFIAGTGLEENGIAGIAAIDETTPVFGLVAPAGGVVMIPLWIRVYYDTEGAAAQTMHWYYVQADKAAYAAGTVLPAINCLGGSTPRVAQGRLLYTLTGVTATTSAQNVVIEERAHVLDNFWSIEGVTTLANQETPGGNNVAQQSIVFKNIAPFGLADGSHILFCAIDATARYNIAAAWIEVPTDPYLP